MKQTLLEFILTVMLYKLPKMSREEIENMLDVTDIRQTRVFQEALEEGRVVERTDFARKMLLKNRPIAEIAEMTGLSASEVRKLSKKPKK